MRRFCERTRSDAGGTLLLLNSKGTALSTGLNTLRVVLVAGTFITALMLASRGQVTPAALLGLGIIAHFWLWSFLRRERRRNRVLG